MWRLALPVATVMVLACDSTAPDDAGGTLSYAVVSARPEVTPPPDYEPVAAAAVEQDRVVVQGRFFGGLCGAELETRFEQDGGVLRLRLWIRAQQSDAVCPAEVVETEYRGVFDQVPGGAYAVEVTTWYGRRGIMDTAAAGTVEVP